jgi:hypothetical protein
MGSGTLLGRATKEGDSPVHETDATSDAYLSRTAHVKRCLNLGRPLSKAKYVVATDSEIVP